MSDELYQARIVALADVYDALTSRRPYKVALTHDVARSMIVPESGAHFDPEVVEVLIGHVNGLRQASAYLTD